MEWINQIYSLMQVFPFLKWTQEVLDGMPTKNVVWIDLSKSKCHVNKM